MDYFTKIIIGLGVTTLLSWTYCTYKSSETIEQTYSNDYLKQDKGTIDTIYQSKENNAPWRTFTKEDIIKNKYPKRKKY